MSMARGEPFDMSLVLHRHPRTLVRSARGAHVQDGAHRVMALRILERSADASDSDYYSHLSMTHYFAEHGPRA